MELTLHVKVELYMIVYDLNEERDYEKAKKKLADKLIENNIEIIETGLTTTIICKTNQEIEALSNILKEALDKDDQFIITTIIGDAVEYNTDSPAKNILKMVASGKYVSIFSKEK